jgi:8-oxo-dGTP pyrophosphatase MutT (NUDIX family)
VRGFRQNDSVLPLAATLLADLDAYAPADGRERTSLTRIRDFVSRSRNAFSRANPEGHVTASAVVAQPEDPVFLLIWHRKLKRWLQPGGHMEEGDLSVFAAALREAREETGLERFRFPIGERILDVDVHSIPSHGPDPAHFHFDIRYLLTVSAAETDSQDHELRWFALRQAVAAGIDESLERALRKAAQIIDDCRLPIEV